MLTKNNFKCDRHCGKCCIQLSVTLSKQEIKKIKNLGYKEEDFLDDTFKSMHKRFIKKKYKRCYFLKKSKKGKYSCIIHKIRPKMCKQYPFYADKKIKGCLPSDLYPSSMLKSK